MSVSFRGDVHEANEADLAMAAATGGPPPPTESPGDPWGMPSRDDVEPDGDFDAEDHDDAAYWNLNGETPTEVDWVRGDCTSRSRRRWT